MALTITNAQAIIVANFRAQLETAFTNGVTATSGVADPIAGYENFSNVTKQIVKIPFEALVAALIKELNLTAPLPTGLSTTTTLAKLTPSGTNGSLTFVNGLLASKVDPT